MPENNLTIVETDGVEKYTYLGFVNQGIGEDNAKKLSACVIANHAQRVIELYSNCHRVICDDCKHYYTVDSSD